VPRVSGQTTGPAGWDLVQPFRLEASGFHGRLVRLGPAVETILSQHSYPLVVAGLLAQSAALCSALASVLKYEGVFSLQLSGDGPIRYLVCDVTSVGAIRAFAGLRDDFPDDESLHGASLPRLFGSGYLAMTIDQGASADRYQGVVDLTGATLTECVHHYFQQSEQFSAAVKLHSKRDSNGRWRSAALMTQMAPESANPNLQEPVEEAWRRTMILQGSCTDAELVDDRLSAYELLFRLFHEEGVRVFEARPLAFKCRCSTEKVELVLRSLTTEALEEMIVDDKVTVTCEFCRHTREFDRSALGRVRAC
jgi:molecular chaperone Hsp33